MSEFTKGEWKADKTFSGLVKDSKGHLIASAQSVQLDTRSNVTVEEMVANAHLISAAPDMYEALREKCHHCNVDPEYDSAICDGCGTRKALAKADGK